MDLGESYFAVTIWSIIHQQVMLEGPESPKSLHKLVQLENVSISAFYMIILVVQGGWTYCLALYFEILAPPPIYPRSGPLKHYDISMEYTREVTNIPKVFRT